MTFVNRESELAALDRWWGQPGAVLGVAWGRRRVGKSWLLRHWSKNKRAVFHVARNQSVQSELRSLSDEVAVIATPMRRNLLERPFHDWDDAFDVLAELAEKEPLLLILDEFPELLKASPELESALRSIWERVESTSNLRVLLCGSSVRVMEAIQEQSAPLYNRMTLRMQVEPFRANEISRMLPQSTPLERAAAWGVCGGLPFYLARWSDGESLQNNLRTLFCSETALLLAEGEFVLATEDVNAGRGERLPERVIRAIASGRTSYSEIRAAVNTLPQRALTVLERNRLVARVQPVTAKRTKLTYYKIADNFLAFWLSQVEPHRGAIEQGLGGSVLPVMVAAFDDYMGARWEDAVREHVRVEASQGRLRPDVVDVGEYWKTQIGPQDDPCQLDVVALSGRSRKVGLVGEVKWAKQKAASPLLASIQRKASEANLPLLDDVTWLVAARDKVTSVPDGVLAVTTHDVFA